MVVDHVAIVLLVATSHCWERCCTWVPEHSNAGKYQLVLPEDDGIDRLLEEEVVVVVEVVLNSGVVVCKDLRQLVVPEELQVAAEEQQLPQKDELLSIQAKLPQFQMCLVLDRMGKHSMAVVHGRLIAVYHGGKTPEDSLFRLAFASQQTHRLGCACGSSIGNQKKKVSYVAIPELNFLRLYLFP